MYLLNSSSFHGLSQFAPKRTAWSLIQDPGEMAMPAGNAAGSIGLTDASSFNSVAAAVFSFHVG